MVMREKRAAVVFHERRVLNLSRLVILFAPTDGARRCEQIADFTLLARMLLNITDVLVERDYQHERDDRTWVFGNFTRISVLALVLLLAAGVITENPLINLLFLLTVGWSIFAALVGSMDSIRETALEKLRILTK